MSGRRWTANSAPAIREGLDKVGIYAFPKILDSGYRNITTSTRPINTVDDLKGLKMRVPPSPVWVSLFTALGSSPTSITINELYSALQTKIVDGQENPLTVIEAGKYYEVQKYCSITEHMWDGLWIIANGKRIKALAPDDLALITKSFEAATVKQRTETARLNTDLEGVLKGKGLVFNSPDKKRVPRHALQGRLLRGLEAEIRPGGLGSPGEVFRTAGLILRKPRFERQNSRSDQVHIEGLIVTASGPDWLRTFDRTLGWLIAIPTAVLVLARDYSCCWVA